MRTGFFWQSPSRGGFGLILPEDAAMEGTPRGLSRLGQGSCAFVFLHLSVIGQGLPWGVKPQACVGKTALQVQTFRSKTSQSRRRPRQTLGTGGGGSESVHGPPTGTWRTLSLDSDLMAFPGHLRFRIGGMGGCLSCWNHKSTSADSNVVINCSMTC